MKLKRLKKNKQKWSRLVFLRARMRLVSLLLLLGMMQVYATGLSQNINLHQNDISLFDAIKSISKQSGYNIIYNASLIRSSEKVDLDLKNADIRTALDQCIRGRHLSYTIKGKSIILQAKEKADPGTGQNVSHVSESIDAKVAEIIVTGKVIDDQGHAMEGVSVVVKGTSKGTMTDAGGVYQIKMPEDYDRLLFSYVGYIQQEILVDSKRIIDVTMQPAASEKNDVVVVGFGTQKRESMVSAITTVDVEKIRQPSSNLTTMFAGQIPGMIAYQRTGEPGKDNASFFIRGLSAFGSGKQDPLILIDGIESSNNDLARLQPDDISKFSVLKDATAVAVYGARGANGVLLITTKAGMVGTAKFFFRMENSINSNTEHLNFADNITYMQLANEAALTRDPLAAVPYSQNKIDQTMAGTNPLLYPSNDWIHTMIKSYTYNQRYNLNVTGGGKVARYYLSGTYNVDNGILKSNPINNFNNNIKLKNYNVRSNVDLNVTSTTKAAVRVYAQFDDYNGPNNGDGGRIFNNAAYSNPVAFPAIYPADYLPYVNHPLFGNAVIPGTQDLYVNPYAYSVSGYYQSFASTINVQFDASQDLRFILPGLNFNFMAYVKRYSNYSINRNYNPFYYSAETLDNRTISDLYVLNDGSASSIGTVGSEYLSYNESSKDVSSMYYAQATLNYAHNWGPHAVSGMLTGLMQSQTEGNSGSLAKSLPHKNEGLSGRFTYGFNDKYLAEFNFGYNGSERFADTKRFGFFPSIGLAYNISKEAFFDPLLAVISKMKLRFTYGVAGNDQIGNADDRFFYLSDVNMNDNDYGSTFGLDYGYSRPGIYINRYPNESITWMHTRQYNLGVDLTLFKKLDMVIELYKRSTDNILMTRSYIPNSMGLMSTPQANTGKAENRGIDFLASYKATMGKHAWLETRVNLTYATSKTLIYDEPIYPDNLSYLTHVGYPVDQVFGYIADHLFIDDAEVKNSPAQTFGEYMAGDLKYRDVNGDGSINQNDLVPIGYPLTPEIIYGAGFSFGYKKFDISAFFQGSARSSFWINPENISPFVINGNYQNNLLKAVAEDHWSENNRNSYAFWPRLSDRFIGNNNQTSTWWMEDGTFLRMKTLELGYSFGIPGLKVIGFKNARVYANGNNLFVWSKFKLWDPEMGGNGLGYPIQRTYNIGINFNIE